MLLNKHMFFSLESNILIIGLLQLVCSDTVALWDFFKLLLKIHCPDINHFPDGWSCCHCKTEISPGNTALQYHADVLLEWLQVSLSGMLRLPIMASSLIPSSWPRHRTAVPISPATNKARHLSIALFLTVPFVYIFFRRKEFKLFFHFGWVIREHPSPIHHTPLCEVAVLCVFTFTIGFPHIIVLVKSISGAGEMLSE